MWLLFCRKLNFSAVAVADEMAKFSNGVRLLAAAVCFWSCCVQQPVFGAEAVVSARAIADYHQNVFDPNNITGSPEAVQEARAPVNVETTAATW